MWQASQTHPACWRHHWSRNLEKWEAVRTLPVVGKAKNALCRASRTWLYSSCASRLQRHGFSFLRRKKHGGIIAIYLKLLVSFLLVLSLLCGFVLLLFLNNCRTSVQSQILIEIRVKVQIQTCSATQIQIETQLGIQIHGEIQCPIWNADWD